MNDGGAETLVKDYCVLGKQDTIDIFPVVIYPSLDKGANEKTIIENDIRIEKLYDSYSIVNRVINKIYPSITSSKLKKVIEKYQPEAIHVHMLCLRYLVYISDYLRDKNIKLFYTCHNNPDFMMDDGGIEYKACKYLIEHNGLQMIALHPAMATKMNAMYGVDNTVVINNGIDFSKYKSIKLSKKEIRKEIGIPADCYLIGHVGRFSEEKNHQFILKVFKDCLNVNSKAYLLLIGNGPLESKIKQQAKKLGIEDKIIFLSHRTDVPFLLNAMDCFVFPSVYEGLGMAVIEAQLAGLKVVMSDTVPKEACLSRNLIIRSLNDSVELWVQSILFESADYKFEGDIKAFDMRHIIKNLEELYLNTGK